MEWQPKTKLGRLVEEGKITTIHAALNSGLPLREPEIVDILLPDMEDVVLDVNMVQRMTDSGRRVRFSVTVVVGNRDGYVGVGSAKGQEVGPTIRKAIDVAKLNLVEIKRGCGSWECGCGKPHTFPFAVTGKSGSVRVGFRPAPRGISLAVSNVAKDILTLAGIEDAWGWAKGHTKTTVNYAYAVFDALKATSLMRVPPELAEQLHIHTGPAGELPVLNMGTEAMQTGAVQTGAVESPEEGFVKDGVVDGGDGADGGDGVDAGDDEDTSPTPPEISGPSEPSGGDE